MAGKKKTKATAPPACPEGIRIGTIVRGGDGADYMRQILPHGFESFAVMFWQTLGDVKLPTLAREINEALADSGAVVGSLGIFGDPLKGDAAAAETIDGWRKCIDAAVLFGCDLVTGFTGRVPDTKIDGSIKAFKKVFAPLSRERPTRACESPSRTATWAARGIAGRGTSPTTRRPGR